MRIVTREEFLKMPAGTVYMVPDQEPAAVGIQPGIYIKGETDDHNDCWWCTPTENWQWDDCVSEFSKTFDESHRRDVPMDYESEERHDDDRKWIRKLAVLSDADVAALCCALTVKERKDAEVVYVLHEYQDRYGDGDGPIRATLHKSMLPQMLAEVATPDFLFSGEDVPWRAEAAAELHRLLDGELKAGGWHVLNQGDEDDDGAGYRRHSPILEVVELLR